MDPTRKSGMSNTGFSSTSDKPSTGGDKTYSSDTGFKEVHPPASTIKSTELGGGSFAASSSSFGAGSTGGILDSSARPFASTSMGQQGQQSQGQQQQGGLTELEQLKLDELQKSAQKLADDGMQLMGAVNTVISGARDVVLRTLESRPYATLGAAAGVGYVLGGGLSSVITRAGVKMGTRIVLAKVAKDILDATGLSNVMAEKIADDTEKPTV